MISLTRRLAFLGMLLVLALAVIGCAADETADAPIDEPVVEEQVQEEPVEEPTEEMVEEPTEEMMEEPTEEPMEEPTEEMMEEPTEEPMEEPTEEPMPTEEAMAEAPTTATAAVDLRVALTNLLGEHVLLASSATGAALDGRTGEFEAAAAALDENTVDLAAAIGSVYGEEAEMAFLELWREHIGFFVDYTNAAAAGDEAAKEEARAALANYAQEFAAFLESANPENIDPAAIESALDTHIETLLAVIDAQAAGDSAATYSNFREAYAHMSMTALALTQSIVAQFPDMFAGDPATPAADLRVGLNALLGEHVGLAATATNAALDGRTADFEAAAAALDENTVELAAAIGSVYGEEFETTFLAGWREHIGYFVDYTNAVAAGDQAAKDEAVANLQGYVQESVAYFTAVNPYLTAEALESILTEHVFSLAGVVDAQGAEDHEAAYMGLREAYAHMQMLADPLAAAIVQQFPEMFQA